MSYPMIHICFRVFNLEDSCAFYQKAFGFEISREKDFPGDFKLLYLRSPGHPFELELTFNYGRSEPYHVGDGYSHFAVGCDDLESSHRHHQSLGLDPGPLKGLGRDGKAHFYFLRDPDGYLIEVIGS